FAFQADTITTSLPASDNFADSNSSVIITRQPSADQISDAINNVPFACTGVAGNGGFDTALFTLTTRHTFRFQPQITGRLTAHAQYMPQGGFSLVGRAPTGWFGGPGVVSLDVFARARLRVRRANGTL